MLDIQVEGLEEATDAWLEMAERAFDVSGANDAIHEIFLEGRARDFASSGATSAAGRWAPRKASTLARKPGGRLMDVTGRLRRSLTDPGHPEHVFIGGRLGVEEMGTRVPYAALHQRGTRWMVPRPVVAAPREEITLYGQAVLAWIAQGRRDGGLT